MAKLFYDAGRTALPNGVIEDPKDLVGLRLMSRRSLLRAKSF